ncbi:MAG: hypothetical protein Q9218_006913 [Villophora microphyllina]
MQAGSRGSSLLRCQTSLLPFLAPSVPSTFFVTVSSSCRPHFRTAICKQTFSTSTHIRQAASATAAAAAPERQPPEDNTTRSDPAPLLKPSRSPPDSNEKPFPSFFERFKSPNNDGQPARTKEDRDREMNGILDDFKSADTTADYVEKVRAAGRRKDFATAQAQRDPRQGRIFRDMLMPKGQKLPDSAEFALHEEEPTRHMATIKSRPSLGRTVEVMPERGLDLGRALRSLEINCAVNNVRNDRMMQRFHERGGAKRKRLKSVRWRRNFKQGFKAVVAKVKTMRRKGW